MLHSEMCVVTPKEQTWSMTWQNILCGKRKCEESQWQSFTTLPISEKHLSAHLHSRDVFVNFSPRIFYTPPTLSPVATSTFPPPTSPHSLPPAHSTPPPHLCHWRQGATSGAICIYITHVNMLSAPLAEPNSMVSTWHSAHLSSQDLIPRLISLEARVE